MTAFAVVGLAAFGVSALTLFSGFGLGTLLLPVFALFFSGPVAVASTALVHVGNNVFKGALLFRSAERAILLRFGIPAVGSALLGAGLLGVLAEREPLLRWRLAGHEAAVTPVGLALGLLVLGFAVVELVPTFHALRLPPRWLPLGGALSGFFGGLSGHQGALRAAFLSPLGLSPAQFAGTQAALACMVDASRLLVYGAILPRAGLDEVRWPLVIFAMVCAFGGALLGRRLLPSVTIPAVRRLTGGLLVVVGALLAAGIG